MLFFWLTEISLASDNWTCENSIFSIFSLFSGQHFVTLQIHYTAIENANIAFHKVENNVFKHSNVSFKHSNLRYYCISIKCCKLWDKCAYLFNTGFFSKFKIFNFQDLNFQIKIAPKIGNFWWIWLHGIYQHEKLIIWCFLWLVHFCAS